MSIEFVCDECGASTDVTDDLAGKNIRCRECDAPGVVPEAKEVAPLIKRRAYACPFCRTSRPWVWRSCWTPVSTVALFLAMPAFFAAFRILSELERFPFGWPTG